MTATGTAPTAGLRWRESGAVDHTVVRPARTRDPSGEVIMETAVLFTVAGVPGGPAAEFIKVALPALNRALSPPG